MVLDVVITLLCMVQALIPSGALGKWKEKKIKTMAVNTFFFFFSSRTINWIGANEPKP